MRCVHPQSLHTGSGPGSVQPAAAFTPLWLSWGAEEWHLPLDCLSGIIHQFNSLLLQPGDKANPIELTLLQSKCASERQCCQVCQGHTALLQTAHTGLGQKKLKTVH